MLRPVQVLVIIGRILSTLPYLLNLCSCNIMASKRYTVAELTHAIRLAPETAPNVYKVDDKTVVKRGDATRLAEAAAMDLVRCKTSIPVPTVYNAYVDETDSEIGTIVMEFIEGNVLRDVWEDMNSRQKESIISQLKGFMEELRAIKGSFIGSVDGTSCEDQLFTEPSGGYGPYATESEFHEGIVQAMQHAQKNVFVDMVSDMVRAMPPHQIVLTHSDLAPRNILVRGDVVVGILDWELAGFYPEYWEYVKALYRPKWESAWIQDRAVDAILKPYHLEHAVMRQVRDVVW